MSVEPASLDRLGDVLAGAVGWAAPGERAGRREVLAAVLAARMAATGCARAEHYLDRVGTDAEERQQLVEAVLVGETCFWRNPPQMRALREVVLPGLLRHAAGCGRRLRIWSAGCSTGEEPYSLAMMIAEVLPDRRGWDIRVLGTDVSRPALSAAAQAEYGPRSVAGLDQDRRQRWLVPVGPNRWRVRDELRELVELRRHNLVSDPAPLGGTCPAELVVCRNVTIYFDRTTTQRVVASLRSALTADGLLMLGHAETLWKLAGGFSLTRIGDAFLYRRTEQGDRVAADAAARDGAGRPGVESTVRPSAPAPVRQPALVPVRQAARPVPVQPPARRRPHVPSAQRGAALVLDDAVRALADGDYPAAARHAARCAELTPLAARAHYLSGLALVSMGELEQARAALRRAVYVDPGAGFAHFLLASVLSRLGEPNAARLSYRSAADTLGTRAGDDTAPELGGRSVQELAELCRSLAGDRP